MCFTARSDKQHQRRRHSDETKELAVKHVWNQIASTHFVDHVLELSLGGVLTKGAHNCAELIGRDDPIVVYIEEGESLLELYGVSATCAMQEDKPDQEQGGTV